MVTYQLEWRTGQKEWTPNGVPVDSFMAAANKAAHDVLVRGEEFRVVGISTELQPDGTIVRRELSPDELSAAIRGEQVEPKPVKAVVVVWDEDRQHEAVYVDGSLFTATDLTQYDELDAGDIETIAAGQPITIRACQMDRPIEDWPQGLGALRLDD